MLMASTAEGLLWDRFAASFTSSCDTPRRFFGFFSSATQRSRNDANSPLNPQAISFS